ncbi:hypothetical protein LY76DRAFT_417412 [Colletotrichum caudatum]|nr:hypothetical protein LY76DRAFT_417412 [Colletotrichum caudatum]
MPRSASFSFNITPHFLLFVLGVFLVYDIREPGEPKTTSSTTTTTRTAPTMDTIADRVPWGRWACEEQKKGGDIGWGGEIWRRLKGEGGGDDTRKEREKAERERESGRTEAIPRHLTLQLSQEPRPGFCLLLCSHPSPPPFLYFYFQRRVRLL